MKKLICILIGLVVLSGCADGDRFDGLVVVDGNARKLVLKHNIGDTYFIDVVGEGNSSKSENQKINEKLK